MQQNKIILIVDDSVADFIRKPPDVTEFLRVTAKLGLKWVLLRA